MKQNIHKKDFSVYLAKIRKGNKSAKQEKTFANINMLFNARKKTMVQLFLKQKKKQDMEKGLSIALAQVKTGNNSDSFLNEIKQIIYSLHQSREITKKV